MDDEERYQGVRCVAAPVFDHMGEVVASVSVSGPSSQMGLDRIEELKQVVCDVTTRLSTQLGYTNERIE